MRFARGLVPFLLLSFLLLSSLAQPLAAQDQTTDLVSLKLRLLKVSAKLLRLEALLGEQDEQLQRAQSLQASLEESLTTLQAELQNSRRLSTSLSRRLTTLSEDFQKYRTETVIRLIIVGIAGGVIGFVVGAL